MKTNDKVSIIMPCYNSQEFIHQAIESVLTQTHQNFELIIINDNSNDLSEKIIEKFYSEDKRITYIKNNNNIGVANSRNRGIYLATGRYIAFIDSDDKWRKNKLEKQINLMSNEKIPFCYSSYLKIDENNLPLHIVNAPKIAKYKDLLKTCFIGCSTAIYDTHFLGKVQMSTNNGREDYLTWLNILKKIPYAVGSQEVLAEYRVHKNQSSAKKLKMAKENWKIYRNIENFSFLKSIYYFSHYATRGLIRTKFPNLAKLLNIL